jgi:predicted nucleotidyltransferase
MLLCVSTAPSPQLLAALQAVLPRQPGVAVALLFGSEAQGRAEPGSDVDLALLGAAPERLGELAAQVSERIGREVDVVRLEQATTPLLEELIDHGVVVYEALPGSAATAGLVELSAFAQQVSSWATRRPTE